MHAALDCGAWFPTSYMFQNIIWFLLSAAFSISHVHQPEGLVGTMARPSPLALTVRQSQLLIALGVPLLLLPGGMGFGLG